MYHMTDFQFFFFQTGRKPSGLCGAALYISALSHGLKCSKSDFVSQTRLLPCCFNENFE